MVIFPDNKFAGKSIKYGNGVRYIHDFTYSGNEITGAKSPDKKRVGKKNSLSIDDAFSVQKQKQAIIDCIKNCIKKEKNVEMQAKRKIPMFGIHKLSGFKIKKIEAIIIAKGRRVNCSAIC